MAKNKIKYRLTCIAPNHLTTYNPKHNESVKETCDREDLFEPTIKCIMHSSSGTEKCKYLEVKSMR